MMQLKYQVCFTSSHTSFYLWLTGLFLKHCKVQKYCDQDCLKIFFLHSTLSVMIWVSRKNVPLGQKYQSCLEITNKWRWKLSRVNFWSKLNIQNNFYTKNVKIGILTQLTSFIFSLKIEEMLSWYTKSHKKKIWRRMGQVTTNNMFAQRILGKIFRIKLRSLVKLDRTRKV